MCGLAGFLAPPSTLTTEAEVHARRMADAMTHRGPDAGGAWVDGAAGIALAHRRLSVLDLSPAGHQPMTSESGRFVLAYNGEIYNHHKLREELGHVRWRGHSDTETLLEAVQFWGVEAALMKCVGMFAIALWDRRTETLTLARDRLGEKPLYYGWVNGKFMFSSELKGMRAHPEWHGEVDRNALALYMRYNYIPAPLSIYRGIYKLPPGTYLSIGKSHRETSRPDPVAYWSAADAAQAGLDRPFSGDAQDAVTELDRLLREVISQQMVADVPLGAFLSGGIDSSTVVALMQAQSSRPVMTFTIAFHDDSYNEAEHAKAVARHLGTDHTELYVTPEQAMSVIPKLSTLYDEPFADSSQLPTYLVAELARRHVTVSLTGDGGDELFGGYNRYIWASGVWRRVRAVPAGMRELAAHAVTAFSPGQWDRIFKVAGPLLPGRLRVRLPGEKLHKLAGMLDAASPEDVYLRLVSLWQDPAAIIINACEPPNTITDSRKMPGIEGFTLRMMYLDLVTYLPDDILVKVDRAAMGVSLETRVPFLDHRVVEFAWQLPLSVKIRDGQGKWPLRRLLSRYVPDSLIERPKMGFGVPLDSWLRGPLRDWAEELLDQTRLAREGYFHPGPIREKWLEHLSGKRNWQHHLWAVLMFQAWLEQQV